MLVRDVVAPEMTARGLGLTPDEPGGRDDAGPATGPVATPRGEAAVEVSLLDLADVRRELAREGGGGGDASRLRVARLEAILASPLGGRRRLVVGIAEIAGAVADVGRRAPNLAEATALVVRHLRASAAMGTPLRLQPLVLLGGPGTGKTWWASRVAAALGMPFKPYPMNMQTLSEGLAGSHPQWRSAAMGLVAATLLEGEVANPLVLVDEVDKAVPSPNAGDPYRALYSLLEREGAREFRDEYLGFPIRADGVLWLATANDLAAVPAPIVDRMTVVEVPAPSREAARVVARSVHAEANARNGGFFEPDLAGEVLEALAGRRPRDMRATVEDAMTSAAADGRRGIATRDLRGRSDPTRRIGFGRD